MTNYIKIFYDDKKAPLTEYPFQLCQYLFQRFNMKKGNKLLDVGCGRGDFIKEFKNLGLEVFGIDREIGDSENLKNIEVRLVNLEKEKFPFDDGMFDIVFSKSVIEHLWDPDNFIKEISRVLKPGGIIILMAPDWQSQKLIFYDDHTHVHPYTFSSLNNLLKMYGFKEVVSEKFYQLPVLWKYPLLKIFSKILQLFGPVGRIYNNKFLRWSRELMICLSEKNNL